jgi:hypothetical protein
VLLVSGDRIQMEFVGRDGNENLPDRRSDERMLPCWLDAAGSGRSWGPSGLGAYWTDCTFSGTRLLFFVFFSKACYSTCFIKWKGRFYTLHGRARRGAVRYPE